MPEPKFYAPHPFQSRGSGVTSDRWSDERLRCKAE